MKTKSILLIGLGRFGRHIALRLNDLGHEVMAVDRDEQKINEIMPFVTSAEIGDSTNEQFLKSLGVDSYDVAIVTISGDFQSSLETTYMLKELGAKKVVSRAERDGQAKFLLRNGADEIVYPEKQICEHIVFTLLVQIARTLSWSWTEGLETVQEEVLRRIGRLERMFRQTDGLVIGIFDEKRLQAFENSLMQDASFMESIRHKLSDYLSGLKEETPEPEEIVQAAYELFLGEIKMFDDRNGGNERFFDSNLLGLLSQQSQNNSTNVQAFVRLLWERAGAYIRLNPDETAGLRQNNAEAGTFTGVLVCLPEHCNGEKQQEYVRLFKQACEEQFHDIIWAKGKYNEITIIKCLGGFSIRCLSD